MFQENVEFLPIILPLLMAGCMQILVGLQVQQKWMELSS